MTKQRKGKWCIPARRRHDESRANLTNEKLWQKMAAKYPRPTPLLLNDKIGPVIAGLIGAPFILFFPFLGRHLSESSFQPIFVVMVMGQLWVLLTMVIGHRAITQEAYEQLSAEAQQNRLWYDGFWGGLMGGGFAVYTAVAIAWGVVEIGISQGQLIVGLMLVGLDIVVVLGLLAQQDWLVRVMVEGLEKHKGAARIWSMMVGFLSLLMVVGGGLGSVARVVAPASDGYHPLAVPAIVGLNILAIIVLVLGMLGLVIAKAHYQQWRQTK